jgi:hypothetical protein
LSGVVPGTYTITAVVDEVDGRFGQTQTDNGCSYQNFINSIRKFLIAQTFLTTKPPNMTAFYFYKRYLFSAQSFLRDAADFHFGVFVYLFRAVEPRVDFFERSSHSGGELGAAIAEGFAF